MFSKMEQAQQPSISLPKGGGAIRGIGEKFAANPVTGTASMTVPIAVSPGRSGFGPQLSLSYDSGTGNGPFGFGWNLSVPTITRKTDKGLPRYNDNKESDVFILSGAEDLVPVLRPDGSRFEDIETAPGFIIHRYRPRIEGLFARIERWTNRATGESHWRSITRDNITTLYGKDKNARVSNPSQDDCIFSWLISESYDDKGNATIYGYAVENTLGVDHLQLHEKNRSDLSRSANRYLKSVKYGNLVSRLKEPDLTQNGWLFEVIFDYDEGHYEDLPLDPARPEEEQHRYILASAAPERTWSVRPDPFSSNRAGFEVRTYRRCRRVLMFHRFSELGNEPCLVRSTDFAYADFDYSEPSVIEAELAHQGSTRFASFLSAVTQAGYVRIDSQPVISKNGARYATYLKKSLPPLEFGYSKSFIQEDIREIDVKSLENLPAGLDGANYRWVDLDGDGLPGILTEQSGAWFYKPNLGEGRFGSLEKVFAKPSTAALREGRQQLLDLAGDGQLDLAEFAGPTSGFFERTHDRSWEPFRPFASLPNIPWDEPNLRFVDLNGDGHADVLISEHEVFTWYPSLAEEGFGAAHYVRQSPDEEQGPRLVFADGTQSVYLADMSGDGLPDLARIRNGEVCYWPNLGYGRFGRRVNMDNAPWFDNPDQFNQQRIRLADIDGSGNSDIIYLGREGARLYFNQSGNRWSEPRTLSQFPRVDELSSVMTADLFGNGTAYLVWSSPLPGDTGRQLRYIDLMCGQKPHLLISTRNNLGAETHIHYVSSTKFYLADKAAGRPWITRLPFPVHVVERIETYDRISRNLFVVRYAYHHGYFDGMEREFRGFGLVEQWDTEAFAALSASDDFPFGDNMDPTSNMPQVLTKTWFHTGAFMQGLRISRQFEQEYYREPGLSDTQFLAQLLPDTDLPPGLCSGEAREACRALKGSLLRQEVYALDGTEKEPHPYSVSERSYALKLLQPMAGESHGVFFTSPCETIDCHYDRNPADPRVSHTLALEVDNFGNVLKSAAFGYGRRHPDLTLPASDQARQTQIFITYTENSFTNHIDTADAYRTPLPYETRTYELTGYSPSAGGGRFLCTDFVHPSPGGLAHSFDSEISYEDMPTGGRQRRLIEHSRTLYRADNLDFSPLPLGEVQKLALLFESYQMAFTPGVVAKAYGDRVTGALMESEGRYVHSEGDLNWWIPSGHVFYSPGETDDSISELAYARQHFFLPHRYRDPFNKTLTVVFDAYSLLVQETRDALGNRVTVGERDQAGVLTKQGNDYRVLQPWLIMDHNRNRAAAAFDALGMVAGTAVMGKPEEKRGDSLEGFEPDLPDTVIYAHLQNPFDDPHGLLGRATARLLYDLFACRRTQAALQPQPPAVLIMARENHDGDLQPGQNTRIQYSFSYSDGFGREIQGKIQAEPGPAGEGGLTVSPRWLGSGWTIFNNKGKPVKQYEPFFTATHAFEFARQQGVSSTLFYDPAGRVVATLHPNHTYEKVVFAPWRQEAWDVNDTILMDPKDDPDAGGFFRRLLESEYLPGWYIKHSTGTSQERDAAEKTARHAATPTISHFDTLGRAFLTIADNGKDENGAEKKYETRVALDIEGNLCSVTDAFGTIILENNYNLLGSTVYAKGMDAGERRMLADAVGKPLRSWDSRGHEFIYKYDALRRPLEMLVKTGGGQPKVFDRMVYGESLRELQPEVDALSLNMLGKVYQHFDTAGLTTNEEFDFKGNLLKNSRQLLKEYKGEVDWAASPVLEDEIFTSSTAYDGLNRTLYVLTPHTEEMSPNIIHPTFNEANLLESVNVYLQGSETATSFVKNIDYNEKGQRTLIEYGNSVVTRYWYDDKTYRLTRLLTLRSQFNENESQSAQDLRYTYDPAGNITYINDHADMLNTIYFRNQRVEPGAGYEYDPLYRLFKASGREHTGQNLHNQPGCQPHYDFKDLARTSLEHPNNGNAMRTYTERYEYDQAGNIRKVIHSAANGDWTRCYQYADKGNRLLGTCAPGDPDEGPYTNLYEYDGHGNITKMPHLNVMEWDFKDQLHVVQRQVVSGEGTGERTYYVYDSAGQRVRKITESQAGPGATPTKKEERIYLGAFEIYRRYNNSSVKLECETLHVIDGKARLALVETKTIDLDVPSSTLPDILIRYQLANHLGSSVLELDHSGRVVSYEECYPYGSTSYQAVRSDKEVSSKRFRFTGKERDEETGFYYHGARYYACWLGRWMSCDPAGISDGLNLYLYARANPIRYSDVSGTQCEDLSEAEIAAQVCDEQLHNMGSEPEPEDAPAEQEEKKYPPCADELDAGVGDCPSEFGAAKPDTVDGVGDPAWTMTDEERRNENRPLATAGAPPPEQASKGYVLAGPGKKELAWAKKEHKQGVKAGAFDAVLGLPSLPLILVAPDLHNTIQSYRPKTQTSISRDVALSSGIGFSIGILATVSGVVSYYRLPSIPPPGATYGSRPLPRFELPTETKLTCGGVPGMCQFGTAAVLEGKGATIQGIFQRSGLTRMQLPFGGRGEKRLYDALGLSTGPTIWPESVPGLYRAMRTYPPGTQFAVSFINPSGKSSHLMPGFVGKKGSVFFLETTESPMQLQLSIPTGATDIHFFPVTPAMR